MERKTVRYIVNNLNLNRISLPFKNSKLSTLRYLRNTEIEQNVNFSSNAISRSARRKILANNSELRAKARKRLLTELRGADE